MQTHTSARQIVDLSGESAGSSVRADEPGKASATKATSLGSLASTLQQSEAEPSTSRAGLDVQHTLAKTLHSSERPPLRPSRTGLPGSLEALGGLMHESPPGAATASARVEADRGDDASVGQIGRTAAAEPAESGGSFQSSCSQPDQDSELIDLTSPPLASLPAQTSNTSSHKRGSTKSGRQTVLAGSEPAVEQAVSDAEPEAERRQLSVGGRLSSRGKENGAESAKVTEHKAATSLTRVPVKRSASNAAPDAVQQVRT